MLRFSPRIQEATADANILSAAGPGCRGEENVRNLKQILQQTRLAGQDARDLDHSSQV